MLTRRPPPQEALKRANESPKEAETVRRMSGLGCEVRRKSGSGTEDPSGQKWGPWTTASQSRAHHC
eukprot:1139474-Pelagomonas_calceolata.AAC.2